MSSRYGPSGAGKDINPKQIVLAGGYLLAAVLMIGAILFFIAPPLVHPFVLLVYARWPSWLIFGLFVAGIVLALFGRRRLGVSMIVVFGLFWLATVVFGSAWQHLSYLNHTNLQRLGAEPETTGIRYLPLEVSNTASTNKSTDPTVTPGGVEPLVEGDDARWIAAREPNNFYQKYFGNQPGVLLINTTADVETDSTEFNPGYGLCCFSNRLGWSAVKEHFWADYSPEDYPYLLDGEIVIVKPYLTYYFDFPVMVPQYGGVLIFHHDGSVEDLTPDEAASKYPEGRFFPHEMASYFARSYQYKDGIINAWFYHRDMPDVPHLDAQNQFPFLIPTDQGPQWYTAVEPYGVGKSAYKAYYQNATTGEVGVYDFPEPLVGPDRAESFASNAFQQLKNAYFIEPRPVVQDGKLYWMLSATTSSYPDVNFTALVDAYSEDVYKLDNRDAVERFVAGEDPGKVGQKVTTSSSTTTSSSETTAKSTTSQQGRPSDEELIQMLRDAADRLEQEQK